MAVTDSIVRLQSVTKGYGAGPTRVEVLRDVDFAVARGELIAVVGPSGVGKSTLLHLVGLLDRPESGTIWLDGSDVAALDVSARARLRNEKIGFVFQFHHLLDELDALDNVALPVRIGGGSTRRARERATELLAAVGLQNRASHFPDQLSGGEQQRVALARALAMEPAVLLADEPTGNLDRATSDQVFEMVGRLHLMVGLTSVIVTHDESLARRCDRVFRLAPAGEISEYVRTI
jgi:predicted ABC-type transport system involved in lysophospholipase L1 biosynthesis ATPase subunit